MISILASIHVFLGLGAIIIGAVTFIIAAFRTSILWGLGVIFFGPASLLYLVFHWSEGKKPFFLQLWGVGFIFVAGMISGGNLPYPFN